MVAKPQLSVRISADLLKKIEDTELPKADIVTEALELYFDLDRLQKVDNSQQQDKEQNNVDRLQTVYIESLIDQINKKDDQILELTKLLDQAQQLQLHTQKLIPDNVNKKPWWIFWK